MEEKKKVEILYKKIGHVWCPALNDCVAFTSAGLRHLTWKGGKRRSNIEQTRRFSLLPYAKEVIENPTVRIAHREEKTIRIDKRHNTTVLAQPPADFWTLTETYDNTTITVVVRQIKDKEKHFFSIYDAKRKNQKTAS